MAKILRIIYALLRDGLVYEERRAAQDLALQEHQKKRTLARLKRHAQRLGFNVEFTPDAA